VTPPSHFSVLKNFRTKPIECKTGCETAVCISLPTKCGLKLTRIEFSGSPLFGKFFRHRQKPKILPNSKKYCKWQS